MMSKTYDIKERAYQYALTIIKLIDHMPKGLVSEIISRQLIKSATSIGANIIEGQSASSRKDFTNYYNHSLKSANESKFWLRLLRDSGKLSAELIDLILNETNELSNILASCILSLRKKAVLV